MNRSLAVLFFVLLAVGLGIGPGEVHPAEVLSRDQASQAIVIRNLKIDAGGVTGELVNNSQHPVRAVQLLIRHTWLWKNEYRPKDDSRSEAVYLTIAGDIPPGGSMPFAYKPSQPAVPQPDGHFETTVSVAGFAQIIK